MSVVSGSELDKRDGSFFDSNMLSVLLSFKSPKMRMRSTKIISMVFSLISVLTMTSWNTYKKPAREFYQLTVYHFQNEKQEKILDNYLKNALLPALHRLKINNVGVFKSWANDTLADKLIYVFIPFKSLEMVVKLPSQTKNGRRLYFGRCRIPGCAV